MKIDFSQTYLFETVFKHTPSFSWQSGDLVKDLGAN